jgi:hypothetical protein
MTTPAAVTRTPSALQRWSLLGGAVYVVFFIAGAIISFSGSPSGDASDAKVKAYWGVASHRNRLYWGWLLVLLGVFFFIWFVAALRQRMRDSDTGFLGTVVALGGALYATTTMIAFSLVVAITTMSDDTVKSEFNGRIVHTVYPELIHAANDAGYVLHAGGAVGISALIIATSVAAMRLGRLGRGLGIVSIVAGVLSLGSIFFFPMILLALWILITSIVVFVRSGSEETTAA